MNADRLRSPSPRGYVAVQSSNIRKILNHVMGRWARKSVDAALRQGKPSPETSRQAWTDLYGQMDEVERIARAVKVLAAEKLKESE